MRYDYTNSMNRGDYPYGESNEYCENDNRCLSAGTGSRSHRLLC